MKPPGKSQRINKHRDDINAYVREAPMKKIMALPASRHMSTMVSRGEGVSKLLLVTRTAQHEFTARVTLDSYPEAMVVAKAIIEAAGIAWPDGEAEMAEWETKNPDPRES